MHCNERCSWALVVGLAGNREKSKNIVLKIVCGNENMHVFF